MNSVFVVVELHLVTERVHHRKFMINIHGLGFSSIKPSIEQTDR